MVARIVPVSKVPSHKKLIEAHRPDLGPYEKLYKDFHQHAELSKQESRTAKIIAEHLKKLKVYEVHEGIGGHGVVGVLRNGKGKTILLRADMDGLPVKEETDLPYASKNRQVDDDGNEVYVMHACGHDMHITPLLAVSATLASARSSWHGTLIVLFQPAEELVSGAQAMIDDGLYGPKYNIPTPDILIGQHVNNTIAGTVSLAPDRALAAVNSMKIRIFGKGGHGTMPEICIDPVLTAAHVTVRLQSIMTREVKPGEMAVLTVGSIQGGNAANVIPRYADIKLTIRSYDDKLQKKIVESVKRVVRAECDATGCEQQPQIDMIMEGPPTINDREISARLKASFEVAIGDNCLVAEPIAGSEDFSILARAINKPYCFWFFGGTERKKYERLEKEGKLSDLPGNHSGYFAPDIQPTLSTAVDMFAVAALTLLDDV